MIDTVALLVALDLVGVFVFAVSGALLAVQHRLDVFGVGILATAAAIGGGLARDVCWARCRRPPSPTRGTWWCPWSRPRSSSSPIRRWPGWPARSESSTPRAWRCSLWPGR